MPINVEIKAHCQDPQKILKTLLKAGAESKGIDHQIDTYFNVPAGRLKLREGNIENNLIYYQRNDQAGPKRSEVILYPAAKNHGLKEILSVIHGIKVVVDKHRHILFIGNVKFHIDNVANLGSFVEIEAIGEDGGEGKLQEQCRYYMKMLNIADADLVHDSYSDILIKKFNPHV